MATVLKIKLAALLPVLAPGLSPRPGESSPERRNFTQLKLTGFKPEVRPVKMTTPTVGSKIDEQELKAIQKYLRSGPAKREYLEFVLNMTSAATLRRLDLLRQRGTVVLLTDNTYALREAVATRRNRRAWVRPPRGRWSEIRQGSPARSSFYFFLSCSWKSS